MIVYNIYTSIGCHLQIWQNETKDPKDFIVAAVAGCSAMPDNPIMTISPPRTGKFRRHNIVSTVSQSDLQPFRFTAR
jgi:hypothetical protein